ncbi:MAG: TetR/AcrR family transcriptional regulator [Nocardioides sp.]
MGTKDDSTPEPNANDTRRTQMLTAAAGLISERGFAQTRIVDVAERVGVSPGLVVYYFATKDQLLTEALRHSESTFYVAAEGLLHAEGNLAARLEKLIDMTFESESSLDVPWSWGLWFDLWAQAFRHPQVASDRRELDDQWRSLITRIVRSGVESGEIDEVDAEEFAVTWAALLDGLSVQVALDDPHVDLEKARELALKFAWRELNLS